MVISSEGLEISDLNLLKLEGENLTLLCVLMGKLSQEQNLYKY